MDRIDAILEAACVLFGEQGFENTKVSDIARMANVASGTVIYHFGKKEAVLFYLAWKFLNTLYRQTLAASEKAPSGREGLDACIHAFFDILAAEPQQFRFLLRNIPDGVNLGPLSTEDLKALHVSYIQLLRSAIARGRDDGSFTDGPVGESAMIIYSILIGSARLVLYFDADGDMLRREALDFVHVRLLRRDPAHPAPTGHNSV